MGHPVTRKDALLFFFVHVRWVGKGNWSVVVTAGFAPKVFLREIFIFVSVYADGERNGISNGFGWKIFSFNNFIVKK